jgi:helicase
MFVDSGGFAALFKNSNVKVKNGLGVIEIQGEDTLETVEPLGVLDFQESLADVAFTLDFPIPPGLDTSEARRRFDLTIRNALWALENRRRRDLPLYACIQAWDAKSAGEAAREYSGADFEGIAVGGLVPRARDKDLVRSILTKVRQEIPDKPIHVFGLGSPHILREVFSLGADSADSSSYVKKAAEGKFWDSRESVDSPSATERLHIALCNLATACEQPTPLSSSPTYFR